MTLQERKELITSYLNGATIQYERFNEWYDLYQFTEDSYIPSFDPDVKYRIKPTYSYVFFHLSTQSLFKVSLPMRDLFDYPKYLPSGPHLMFKVLEEKIVEIVYSDSSEVLMEME